MSLNPLEGGYAPQDPYRQYHGQPEAEQKRQEYLRAEQEALKKQAYMRGTGAISGAGAIGRDALVSRGAGLEYQMERLARTVAASEELFNQLGIRMTPFVRSLPVQEQEKRTHTSDDSQSPLADQVSRLADQLDRINRGMTYLIDGVDL